jgi:hypothetical protein
VPWRSDLVGSVPDVRIPGFGKRSGRRPKSRGEDEALGWDALEAAIAPHVHGEPLHWSTGNLPDQDGAYGISAYRADGCWLVVTFGLSDLFVKTSDDPEVSGWGFELTMRVPRDDADSAPPTWVVNLLTQLAEYVYRSGSPFADGHRMSPAGLGTDRPDTAITALAFTTDPQLGEITTPFGAVTLLTVVGITDEELARAKASSTSAVIADLAASSRLLVTDTARALRR